MKAMKRIRSQFHALYKGYKQIAFDDSKIRFGVISDIHSNLGYHDTELEELSKYYFDGQGKGIRPIIFVSMANAINEHLGISDKNILKKQITLASIAEMFHAASLMHDDVIDGANSRRNKLSINAKWNDHKSIISGVYVFFVANNMLGNSGDPEIIKTMGKILNSLVLGEIQQLSSKPKNLGERFQLYLEKSYNKTASLIANPCRGVADLCCRENTGISEAAFLYGKNIGISFQLIDDWLDFTSNVVELGKPAGSDVKLGLATAPVLFACETYPEIEVMINNNFKAPGEPQRALELTLSSDGLDRTLDLAKQYANEAKRNILYLSDSVHKTRLLCVAEEIVNRRR